MKVRDGLLKKALNSGYNELVVKTGELKQHTVNSKDISFKSPTIINIKEYIKNNKTQYERVIKEA